MANILIIDDDAVLQKTIRGSLVKAGHTVAMVKDGHTALEIVEKETFHLIICDINMPMGINGFKLVKMFRENPKVKTVPIAMISSRRSESDVTKGIGVGIDDYMIKPIDFDLFSAKVASLLNKGGHSFEICRIQNTGFVQTKVEMKIIGISDEGLQFISNIPLALNSKISLESPIYDEIGIGTPVLRLAHTEQLESEDNSYMVKGNFIGLTPGDLQKVRVYINSAKFKKD